jgi:Sulfotransferase family
MMKLRGVGKIRGMVDGIVRTGDGIKREIWQRVNNPTGESKPAFLIGCGRSGTSMLVHQLNKSMRVELYNEDNQAAFEKWRLRDLSVIDRLISDSHANVILFKPILDTYRTGVLMTRYPEAKFIFTFRHFDDVINSSLKRFGQMNRVKHVNSWIQEDFGEFKAMPPPEKSKSAVQALWRPGLTEEDGGALYWFFYNQLYYDLELDQNDRVMLVRYESVVSEPERHFDALCRFLGLPYENVLAEGVFSSSIRREAAPEIDPEIRSACEALWWRLSEEVAERSSS